MKAKCKLRRPGIFLLFFVEVHHFKIAGIEIALGCTLIRLFTVVKTAKFMKRKVGIEEDDEEDEEENEKEEGKAWGKSKKLYYSADNVDYEVIICMCFYSFWT